MTKYIVEDSSFVVAVMDENDAFHRDAISVLRGLENQNSDFRVMIPPLVVYESIVTLRKKGIPHYIVVDKMIKFIHLENVLLNSINEIAAFKHSKSLMNANGELRTHDFMIASIAIDFDAAILTFDKTMKTKVSNSYNKIYYCSSSGNMENDLNCFLKEVSYT